MPALALHDLYVVTSSYAYVGTSLVGETAYTDKGEAEAARQEIAKHYEQGRFEVTTLDAFMSTMRDEANESGRQAERESNNVGY